MQLRKGYLMLAFVAVAALIAADGTDSANVMMEAARKKEVVDGDLSGAIKQYSAIVANQKANRAVKAMALVHMAECYQKMGDAKSREIYELVVAEYTDQKDAVEAARARLGGSSGSGRQSNSGVLSKRMLCPDCGYFNETDFSSDGRLMVFTDWDSGDLATRDMSTGKVNRLMAKTGTWKDSSDQVEGVLLSRDLRQIVYYFETGKEPRAQLRIMPNEPGGKARVVIDTLEYSWIFPTAWSADGKSVLVALQKRDRTSQIAWVSVADGAVRVLKSLDLRAEGIGSQPTISPDGRYIVYQARTVNPSNPPSSTDPQNQRIYVLAADGSAETEVVKTAGINQYPVWTPDGKHILFVSDRSGKFDLWSVAVQNGKAVGSESIVSSEIGKMQGAWMRGNSYYYTKDSGVEYVNIAEFAPRSDNQDHIVHAKETFIGIQPAWSPDGKSIAVKRHHPGSANEYDLVVRSLETGDERTYLTNLGTSPPFAPRWIHDGKAIIDIFGGKPYRIDLKTGEFTEMRAGAPGPALYPNEKTRYAARNDGKLPARIVAVDPSNGREKEIFTLPEPGTAWVMPTPDSRPFVVRRLDQKTKTIHFYRLNVDGTGYREIHTITQGGFRNNFTLTKDGRWILFAKRNNGERSSPLVRISIDGGAPESTGLALGEMPLAGIDLSPDGSRLAFTSRKSDGEVWALDNVLSAVK